MTNKYDSASGPPPPAYGSEARNALNSPAQAHTNPSQPNSDYYGASPYQNNGYPPQNYPPQNSYPPQQGGYYAPGPQMGYAQQQGGYYPPQQGYGPGPYGPQGGYYGRPQGQYVDQRNGSSGFMEAMLASLACCCCLDACLLF